MRRHRAARNVARQGDWHIRRAGVDRNQYRGNKMKSGGFLGFTAAASAAALVALGAATFSDARADGKRDTLYVSDSGANTVQTFDSATGFPKGILIPAAGQPNPFQSPLGLVFHDDDLLVVNQNVDEPIPGEILRFDKETGK